MGSYRKILSKAARKKNKTTIPAIVVQRNLGRGGGAFRKFIFDKLVVIDVVAEVDAVQIHLVGPSGVLVGAAVRAGR